MGRYHSTKDILKVMENVEQLRNVGLVGHIDHGKTTLSDSLLAEAGLLSESLIGEARALDYMKEEQRRGITMKSANVSLYYEHVSGKSDQPFIINLVDTPGHLDFSGKVTRALRLVDGVVVIVDAVEEINSQSETVLMQALDEGVKPILFINKVDRLFRELKLTNDEIEEKFNRIVKTFNNLIIRFSDKSNTINWKVSPENGSVIFGSALHKWGFTIPNILQQGWNFQNISEKYEENKFDELSKIFPIWEAVLSVIIAHIPNPREAQQYRISKIWDGDLTSELGQYMKNCNSDGPLVMCMSNIKYDSHGLIGTGRIFSGTLTKGQKIYMVDADTEERIQKVGLYMGSRTDNAENIPAGNIAAIGGLKSVRSGESIVNTKFKENMTSFESVKYVSEPVVTVAIEPEMLKELGNLQTILDQMLIEDPNLEYYVSKDTGEVLLSGMGPLHLEVTGNQIEERGLNVTISKPMSVFRESIKGISQSINVKSADQESEITLKIQRNDTMTVKFLHSMKITSYASLSQVFDTLKENTTLSDNEIAGYVFSDEYGNMIINQSENLEVESYKGRKDYIQQKKKRSTKLSKKNSKDKIYIRESTLEDIIMSSKSIFLSGPICNERLAELKIIIEDIKLSKRIIEDGNISDITPMFRNAVFSAIEQAGSVLLEPIYELIIQTPPDMLGSITNLLAQHQAKIINVDQHDEFITEITAYMSVREYINFSTELRSKSSGRAFWQTLFHSFEEVPKNKKEMIISEIKFRKGLYF